MKLWRSFIRQWVGWTLIVTPFIVAHDTDFHDTRIINPLTIPVTISVGTIRRTIGGDMVDYTITIAPKSSETVPLRHPNISRLETTMQSPWALISKTLPEGDYIRSFEITYGNGPRAKHVIAGSSQIAALNQCVDLLERQGRRSKESGLQILSPTLSKTDIPVACMIDDSPVFEYGVDNPALEEQDLLEYSADNPDPYEDSLPIEGSDPGPVVVPARADRTRHLYQEDSQYNYPVGWNYHPEYNPEVRPDHPSRLNWHQNRLPGGHRLYKPQDIINPAAIHTSAY